MPALPSGARALHRAFQGLLGLVFLLGLAGCGGQGGSPQPTPEPVGIRILAASGALSTGDPRTFQAEVTGTTDARVTWMVLEGNAGGAISAAGVYQAPDTPGTYTVVARPLADPARSATAPVRVVARPRILGFAATPSEVTAGQPALLGWSVSGAQAVRLDGLPQTGTSREVTPAQDQRFLLEAENEAGTVVQAQVDLPVVAAPRILSFAPDASALTAGEGTVLRWQVADAVELRLDGGPVSGTSATITPLTSGDHVLEASNRLGASVQARVHVDVVAVPRILAFTSDAATLTAGEGTLLRWTTLGASELRVDGAPVTGTSLSLSPAATGDHVLEARNSLGAAVQATVRITVVPAPVITSFGAARTALTAGESTLLSWDVQQAATLFLDGAPVTGTSLNLSPTATGDHVLEARNSLGAAVQATVRITVVAAPTLTLSASSNALGVGDSSLLTWSSTGAVSLTLDGTPVSGSSRSVSPYRTTTYTLRAANSLGYEVVRTQTITVTPYPGDIWFAAGQVWLKWTDTLPLSGVQTYDVYRSEAPIDSLASATLVGRLLPEDVTASRLKLADGAATWVLPAAGGGTVALLPQEAHFTHTPHATATAFYAVIPHGGSLTPSLKFGPVDESVAPISPHPQRSGTDPASGRSYTDYALWLDGRAGSDPGRVDFPVMGPPSFNGMATVFRVYGSPTPATPMPAVLMMHGNGGTWLDHRPVASDSGIDLALDPGLLVTLDDAFAYDDGGGVSVGPTRWFGSWDGFDRFAGGLSTPPNGSLVHPYTLRRNAWIRDWIVRDLGVDPDRVISAGYSMGGLGASTLARYAPEKFSACLALLFHTSMPSGTIGDYLRGTPAQNLPTSLGVTMAEVHDPTVALAPGPLPPAHYLWGVADGVIPWTDKPTKISSLNSQRAGVQIWWDTRLHNPAWTGHWVGSAGLRIGALTGIRRTQSYPAFSQEVGTDTDTSQSWGTRGGYLLWDPDTITETAHGWDVDLWVRGTASLPADVPAAASITVDVSLRRPQAFVPAPGAALTWSLTRISDGGLLQSGALTVGGDGLVTVPALVIPKDPTRVRLSIRD